MLLLWRYQFCSELCISAEGYSMQTSFCPCLIGHACCAQCKITLLWRPFLLSCESEDGFQLNTLAWHNTRAASLNLVCAAACMLEVRYTLASDLHIEHRLHRLYCTVTCTMHLCYNTVCKDIHTVLLHLVSSITIIVLNSWANLPSLQ